MLWRILTNGTNIIPNLCALTGKETRQLYLTIVNIDKEYRQIKIRGVRPIIEFNNNAIRSRERMKNTVRN